MKTLRIVCCIFACLTLFTTILKAQPKEEELVFKFVALDNEFYITESDNRALLNQLYIAIDKYQKEITSGRLPIYVDAYSASSANKETNLNLSFIRANRVKSVLIVNKNLKQDNFITHNHTVGYDDMKDVVVVRLALNLKDITEEKETTPVEEKKTITEDKKDVVLIEKEEIPSVLPKDETVVPDYREDTATEYGYVFDENAMLTLTDIMLDDDDIETASQGITTMAIRSNDVYRDNASFQFSQFRFNIRGYENFYNQRYINGVSFNDQNRGVFNYASIGALNNVTRNGDAVLNNDFGLFTYGSIGGSENIDMRAGVFARGGQLTASYTNRNYYARAMATFATGMMDNGWAFAGSIGGRYSHEGNIEGVFYQNIAYFLAAEKQWNNGKHSLSFNTFGSPVRRGQQGSSYQEVYDLLNNNLYNPNWGYQNGEKRNARVVKAFDPTAVVSHTWNINRESRLTTGIGAHYGRYGGSSLNWYNGFDPRPDYYRYLPSYFEEGSAAKSIYTGLWESNDPSVTQINWDELYSINYLNKLVGDSSAIYNVEERRSDLKEIMFNSTINTKIGKNFTLHGGIGLKSTISEQFKTIEDLLGADYVLDIDKFSERDFSGDENKKQNNLLNPNRRVFVGDVYGYDFDININSANTWLMTEYETKKVDFHLGGKFVFTEFQRDGKMKNGRYPDNSYGKGDLHRFYDVGAKGGLTYKFSGRHFLRGNLSYSTEAPLPFNAYVSPRISDKTIEGLQSGKVWAGDLNYIFSTPKLNGRLSFYQTNFYDQTDRVSYYHDTEKTFVNHVVTGMEKINRGIELGLTFKATNALTFEFAGTISENYYNNNPMGITSYENGSAEDFSETVYYKNYYVGGAPQFLGTIGAQYFYDYWFFNLNVNGVDRNYIDISPLRRLKSTYAGLDVNNPDDVEIYNKLTYQERFDGAITLDASIGKIIYISRGQSVNVNLSVYNILNKKDIRTGGYEQGRVDTSYPDKFTAKYFYMQGINCFLNLSYRF